MSLDKPLLVTAGEPAGIGPEICAALAESEWADDVVVVGDARLLDSRLNIHDIPFPHPVNAGEPNPANAATILEGLRFAVDGCMRGDYSAMVTAPLAKNVIADSGVAFSGHTEYLAELTKTPLPVMLLVAGELRVALASTHIPLRQVADYITTERIQNVLEVLEQDLQTKFGIPSPTINVCGLNPHAGEGGYLGHEDDDIILPAIEARRALGASLCGPLPADTAFSSIAGTHDAVLAMYHDQGLPVLKYAGFGEAVNVTLGLPIIRTSVDHGTAFDLAGKSEANPGSLLAAVSLAASMASSI